MPSNIREMMEALREAAKAATPGPWRDYAHAGKPGEIQIGAGVVNGGGDGWDEWCVATAWGGMGEMHANGRLIALANPQTLTLLLQHVAGLEEALRDLCDAWETNGGKFKGNITQSVAAARTALGDEPHA